jgi:apolipoprotein N-acyltransferase
MEALLGFIGATVVGAGGWWIGEQVGFMTAFMLSMVGTGIGMYAGRRIARDHLS